jgi:hypothetical protein
LGITFIVPVVDPLIFPPVLLVRRSTAVCLFMTSVDAPLILPCAITGIVRNRELIARIIKSPKIWNLKKCDIYSSLLSRFIPFPNY